MLDGSRGATAPSGPDLVSSVRRRSPLFENSQSTGRREQYGEDHQKDQETGEEVLEHYGPSRIPGSSGTFSMAYTVVKYGPGMSLYSMGGSFLAGPPGAYVPTPRRSACSATFRPPRSDPSPEPRAILVECR